jgi:adenylyl-sulfate kinase
MEKIEGMEGSSMTSRRKPRGFTIWMTGLPGSGKSTLANLLKTKYENEYDRFVEVLDGDEVRKGLSKDLGLSKEDREEHARRVSYMAKVLSRNGVISIVALISPYRVSRQSAKEVIGSDRFVEVYVKASLSTCEKRDPKGLYAKARRGEINNMTGIQDPYEEPSKADITVNTESDGPEDCIGLITNELARRGWIPLAPIEKTHWNARKE